MKKYPNSVKGITLDRVIRKIGKKGRVYNRRHYIFLTLIQHYESLVGTGLPFPLYAKEAIIFNKGNLSDVFERLWEKRYGEHYCQKALKRIYLRGLKVGVPAPFSLRFHPGDLPVEVLLDKKGNFCGVDWFTPQAIDFITRAITSNKYNRRGYSVETDYLKMLETTACKSCVDIRRNNSACDL